MKFAFLFLLFAACAPSINSGDPGNTATFSTPDDRDSAYGAWKVTCDSASNCPANVGQLVIKTGASSVAMCTVFVVDANTVVTNAHCTEEFLQVGADCSAQAQIVFPYSSSPAEHVPCGQLVAQTPKNAFTDPDLAIIHLAHAVSRQPLAIDSSGVADQERLTVYKVNPGRDDDPDLYEQNVLVSQTCRVITRPYYLPEFTKANDPAIAFTDCDLMHGNSGSPLVSATGAVKAVVFGHYGENGEDDLHGRNLNLGTNAACLKSPIALNLQGCNTGALSMRQTAAEDSRKREQVAALHAAAKDFEKWSIQNSAFGVWLPEEFDNGDGVIGLRAGLKCVQPSKQWVSMYTKKGWVFNTVYSSGTMPITAPRYTMTLSYDESFRMHVEFKKSFDEIQIDFNPHEISRDRGGVMQIHRSDDPESHYSFSDILTGRDPSSQSVPACGAVVTAKQIDAAYQGL